MVRFGCWSCVGVVGVFQLHGWLIISHAGSSLDHGTRVYEDNILKTDPFAVHAGGVPVPSATLLNA